MDHVHPHERRAGDAGALRGEGRVASFSADALGCACCAQTSVSAVHRVLNAVLSPPHFDKFIQSVAEVMEHSYPFWWPGRGVGLATDNFQMDKTFHRQQLTKKNTTESNPLMQARPHPHTQNPDTLANFPLELQAAPSRGQGRNPQTLAACPSPNPDQAAFSIAYRTNDTSYPGPLCDLGWMRTLVAEQTADHFGIWAEGDSRRRGLSLFETILRPELLLGEPHAPSRQPAQR